MLHQYFLWLPMRNKDQLEDKPDRCIYLGENSKTAFHLGSARR
jgi:hypothetical protein